MSSPPPSSSSPLSPLPSVDPEVSILRQIRGSFLAILRMVESMRSDLTLLGERFDRLHESSERARVMVKDKIRREREEKEKRERDEKGGKEEKVTER